MSDYPGNGQQSEDGTSPTEPKKTPVVRDPFEGKTVSRDIIRKALDAAETALSEALADDPAAQSGEARDLPEPDPGVGGSKQS